jgi:hypothetical protein
MFPLDGPCPSCWRAKAIRRVVARADRQDCPSGSRCRPGQRSTKAPPCVASVSAIPWFHGTSLTCRRSAGAFASCRRAEVSRASLRLGELASAISAPWRHERRLRQGFACSATATAARRPATGPIFPRTRFASRRSVDWAHWRSCGARKSSIGSAWQWIVSGQIELLCKSRVRSFLRTHSLCDCGRAVGFRTATVRNNRSV